MSIRTTLRAARGRVLGGLAALAAVSMAIVVAGIGSTTGTFAQWADSSNLAVGDTIMSGTPGLEVDNELDFTYGDTSLQHEGTITLTNTGDVPLYRFSANDLQVVGGDAALWDAVSVSLTRGDDTTPLDFSNWLENLVIQPGESETFHVVTSLTSDAYYGLDAYASVTINTLVRAHTSPNEDVAGWAVNDALTFTQRVGETATSPAFTVTGFEALDDFSYTFTTIQTGDGPTATITVTNTGDVPLHNFVASLEATDASLWGAITATMTRDDGVDVDFRGNWLEGTEIQPGGERTFTLRTSIDSFTAIADLADGSATTIQVMVTAEAVTGTAAPEPASALFTQRLGNTNDPSPVGWIGAAQGGGLQLNLGQLAGLPDGQYRIMITRFGETERYQLYGPTGLGPYNIPTSRIDAINFPFNEGPNEYTLISAFIVDANGNDVAHATPAFWFRTGSGGGVPGSAFVNLGAPGTPPLPSSATPLAAARAPAAPAPGRAPAAPAPAPEAPATESPATQEPGAGDDGTDASEPAPTPEPDPEQEQEQSEPEPAPAPTPDTVGEVPLNIRGQGDGLRLSWQNPAGLPEGTGYRLYLNGKPTDDTTDTTKPVLDLRPERVPDGLWTAEGDIHEIEVTIVPELPEWPGAPIARDTIWVMAGPDGTFTLHTARPAG